MTSKDTPALPRWADIARAQWTHRGHNRPAFADVPREGQESVWDYPRPPRLVGDDRHVVVKLGSVTLAATDQAARVLETSHPPTFYVPREAVEMRHLTEATQDSRCEWKGTATYWDVEADGRRVAAGAWSYDAPFGEFAAIAGHLSFYPGRFACYVGGQRVRPQPGPFYGGWVTDELAGPFKGAEGTGAW